MATDVVSDIARQIVADLDHPFAELARLRARVASLGGEVRELLARIAELESPSRLSDQEAHDGMYRELGGVFVEGEFVPCDAMSDESRSSSSSLASELAGVSGGVDGFLRSMD